MPNKDFKQDLKDAKSPGRYPHLSDIKSGDYDFSVAFTFSSPHGHIINIEVIISDTTNYPESHSLLVITPSENEMVQKVLELEAPYFKSAALHEVLTTVDRILFDALVHNTITRQEGDVFDGTEDDFEYNSSFDGICNESDLRSAQKMIRRDLRAAKAAGLKVGYYSQARGVQQGATLLSISCHISRLKISDEVMQSWNVNRDEYLVLLLLYPTQYHAMDRILDKNDYDYRDSIVQMRVGLCDAYKPTLEHAERVFKAERPSKIECLELPSKDEGIPLKHLFIGTSLNKLLNCRLVSIARFRVKYKLTWSAAEMHYHAMIGKKSLDDEDNERPPNVADTWDVPAPPPLAFDHFPSTEKDLARASFPLVAMQFTLRHLVKCNSFCAVCHCKISNELDAVKPFVCSNQLCLYQYMTLNMGFSIDHEVLSQPKVVDLLVSLAYTRTRANALTDFPTGLDLLVPVMNRPNGMKATLWKFPNKRELIGEDLKLSVGDWVMIFNSGIQTSVHCRVEAIDSSCTNAQLSAFIFDGPKKDMKYGITACVHVYSHLFDDLEVHDKFHSILTLLNTLPPIEDMKQYLKANTSNSLSNWTDHISPSAFTLFRWIVATNRSCILLDEDPQNLVSDMPMWRQFRIIGTPEKEIGFAENVRAHGDKQFPTLFAWHGSLTLNWHAILREGLNFDTIRNGRSCGHGVYFSSSMNVSMGYTGYRQPLYYDTIGQVKNPRPNTWVSSDSDGVVLTLNEIVNAPEKFVSTTPHLVVNRLDWIQPRYLFLQMIEKQNTPDPLLQVYNQDPDRKITGSQNKPAQVPLSAIPLSRQKDLYQSKPSPKKGKTAKKAKIRNPSIGRDVIIDSESIATEDEDRMILLSDDEDGKTRDIIDLTLTSDEEPDVKLFVPERKNGFVPGTLRDKKLSLMESPKFATPVATRLLQKQLQTTLKVQKNGKLHELGWYIDPELITTPYQWIVELHSFDPELPLAQDMTKAGIKSIILEMRFPDSYPMNPPFIRIVTPKFLEFMNGGGGHVTSGGSMCMELLTSSGWLPSFSIESVLIQVRMALCNMEPQPARLRKNPKDQYQILSAIAGYQRFAQAHGWNIPGDLSWVKDMK